MPLHRPRIQPTPALPHAPGRPRAGRERRLDAERRLRSAGGPEDQATYFCRCGMVFAADVTTSVACPHCTTQQAW